MHDKARQGSERLGKVGKARQVYARLFMTMLGKARLGITRQG
jgi:hypothetical protein